MHIAHHLHPIQQQQHLLLLQLCCELMCLMLKGSRVCKTQGRSYPPPPQMEYCVCVRVYEFLKSWNSNCRCKPALQLQAQASCIIRHTRSRSTDKVSHQRGPCYILLLWADACLLLYNCLSPNNHTKAFPKWPKLFGINKPFPPCWSRLCTLITLLQNFKKMFGFKLTFRHK